MARPRIPDDERCENRVVITLKDEDFLDLRRVAKRKGMGPAVLARSYVKEALAADLAASGSTLAMRPVA